ncbi:hypothetical protein, partial [uncultured Thiodictyon sp.]|uniref:hypothetical protein n=1 Tax=uncultured Thiodictyon sp. TaxID=1846217 RepID=UPI0025F8D81B
RYRDRRYQVPSRTVLREVLTRVDPDALSGALQRWNTQHANDEALAIIQRLARNVRLVFDYLGMTENSRRRRGWPATAG